MFSIPLLEGYDTNFFCENESVVKIPSTAEFVFNKKHILMSYSAVIWEVVSGMFTIGGIDMKENLADIFTKNV